MLRAFTNYQQDNWDQLLSTTEFACNNAPNASTSMTPFHINQGRDPLNPYTMITKIPDNIPAASDWLAHLDNTMKQVTDALVLAKANQEKNANRNIKTYNSTLETKSCYHQVIL